MTRIDTESSFPLHKRRLAVTYYAVLLRRQPDDGDDIDANEMIGTDHATTVSELIRVR